MVSSEAFDSLVEEVSQLKQQQADLLNHFRSTAPAGIDNTPLMADDAAEQFSLSKKFLYVNKERIAHIKKWGRIYFYPASIRQFLLAQKGTHL